MALECRGSAQDALLFAFGLFMTAVSTVAAAGDIFNTQSQISQGPATPLLPDAASACEQKPIPVPLPLFAAIERSLCGSAKTHAAWASVKAAMASVGESKAAYLPTMDGTAEYAAAHEDTTVKGHPELSFRYSQPVTTEALSLSWLLYDFGGREAALRQAKQLAAAAQANQDLVLQAVFAETAKDYYTAQAARAAVDAATLIESNAQQTLAAATARYKTGVSPITDQLQANTVFAQTVFQRTRADGALRLATGTLAKDMSLPVDAELQLLPLDQSVLPDTSFVHAIHDLINEALQSHPGIAAARAQSQAALEDVRIARIQGLPKLSLAGNASRIDTPSSAIYGGPTYPAIEHQASFGIGVTIPLFEGFSRQYKIREAQAHAEASTAALHDTQQQVALDVWTSFQALQTATENLHNTEVILQSAQGSFEAYQQRYRSGLSGILDLLNAQTTLANAELQQIQAQLDWRTTRIELAQSLGQLGLWAVQ